MSNEIICDSCGKKCLDTDKYCRYCHEPIVIHKDTHDKPIEGIPSEDWEKFIDHHAFKYMRIFREQEGKGFFLSFNFGALFFSYYWMFYRKMYKQAIITALLSMVYVLLYTLLITTTGITVGTILFAIPIALIPKIVVALIADWLYKCHCIKNLKPVPIFDRGGISYNKALLFGLPTELVVSGVSRFLAAGIMVLFA